MLRGGLSLSLFLSFCFILCFGRTGENTCRNFGNAAGLGSQPLRWRRSITQTDREVSIGLFRRRDIERERTREREKERPPPNHPYLNIKGNRERPPPSHPPPSNLHRDDRKRQKECRGAPKYLSLCLLLSWWLGGGLSLSLFFLLSWAYY